MQSLKLSAVGLFFFSCLFHVLYPAQAQKVEYNYCDTRNNYTSGSVFERNLNLTLSSLVSNASQIGFSTTVIGQNPNTVYGLLLCRGDISKEDCQACASTASKEIIRLCSDKKEAAVGYDYCSLRYSDSRFFSTVDSDPRLSFYNINNATEPVVFNRQLGNLVRTLSSSAASSTSKFAAGTTNYTDFLNINAMCCGGKQGGRVFSLSCNLRFEQYSFFLLSSPPPVGESSPPSSLVQRNSSSQEEASKVFVFVAIPVAVALVVALIVCGYFFWRKGKKKTVDIDLEEGNKSLESLLIGLDTLKVATRNFSSENKLGEGGFGPVYKGKLFDGKEIAVKRLSKSSGQGLEELKTEVMLVAKLLHKNLVRLVGFCLEEEEKLLVYEYLPNGSLDKILFDINKRLSLEWEIRYKIIVGITRGLLYLHEDSQLRIIHRDLKASNILLDEYMNPKISDFGLARLFGESQTQGNTNQIAGTYGYKAPEYAKNGHFSNKSDIYSYGVMVLEIVTGRKNSSFRNMGNLPSHAWQHWTNGTAMELLDPMLGDQLPKHEVLKCIYIGLLCVQEAAAARPTMSQIVLMLSSHIVTAPGPSRPAFYISRGSSDSDTGMEDCRTSQSQSQSNKSSPESLQQSVNEVTITELDPR
ncbi:hypothetical protein ACOSP7_002599 [Xanthoceras sorbifolium]